MKFKQLQLLTFLLEACVKNNEIEIDGKTYPSMKISSINIMNVLKDYWDDIPDNVVFPFTSLDDISDKYFIIDGGKQKIKIIRLLKELLPTFTETQLKEIADKLRVYGKNVKSTDSLFKGFEIYDGSIYELYKECTNVPVIGMKSCMTKNSNIEFVKFYDWINGNDPNYKPNHNVRVNALIHKNEEGIMDGRALLWYGVEGTGGKPFMDRVYPEREKTAEFFQQYAVASGFAFRKGFGYEEYKDLEGTQGTDISITIDIKNLNPDQKIPYMDTFVSGDSSTGKMSNISHITDNKLLDLQKTTGVNFLKNYQYPDWFIKQIELNNVKNFSAVGKYDALVIDEWRFEWKYGIWNGGIWKSGEWHDGLWKNGEWHYGIWKNGIWEYGIWYNGNWENGEWRGGKWKSGTWENGKWEDGIWKSGTWEGGNWENGIWDDGMWYRGTWYDGTWNDGTWINGLWLGGTWKGGTWNKGKIYDPYKKGKAFDENGNLKDGWQKEGLHVESKISPKEYFEGTK